jgi:hypothetical protein
MMFNSLKSTATASVARRSLHVLTRNAGARAVVPRTAAIRAAPAYFSTSSFKMVRISWNFRREMLSDAVN